MKGIVKGTFCLMLALSSVVCVCAEDIPEPSDTRTEEIIEEEQPGEELPEETVEETPAEEEEEPEEETPEDEPGEEEPGEETPGEDPAPASILETAPEAVTAFVHDLYTALLKREPDRGGWETWVSKLISGTEASEVIRQFTGSVEFQKMAKDPAELAKSLYKGILGREGSDSEVASWASRLRDGQTYHALLQGFIRSKEFRSRCDACGLKAGTYTSPYYADRNIKAARFIMNLYRSLLKRDEEFSGLEGWTKDLLTGTTGAVMITNILNSAEFQQKMPADKEFVAMLYQAVLGRNGSASEVSGWAVRMANGQTWRAVMQGFINSQEYKNRCADIGIKPGTYTSPRYADTNYNVTLFVTTLFRKGLGREGKESDIEYRTKQLLTRSIAADTLVRTFLKSKECRKRNLSNEAYVTMMYECVLGRSRKDTSVGSSWVKKLDQGTTRTAVLNAFVTATEFKKRCTALGIKYTDPPKPAPKKFVQYTPWYYRQGDYRWGNVRIGGYTIARNGCVPTSIAMALSGILNTTVRPDTVGWWLYNNTQEFNRVLHGGSGAANLYAARAWNVSVYGISSLSGLQAALAKGYIVGAIVGAGTFTPAGTTHEIILWGSSGGSCNVYDPASAGRNGRYSISSIWAQRSWNSYDLRGGYVFYAFYK